MKLRDLLAAATPRPWTPEGMGGVFAAEGWISTDCTPEDAALIVALVNQADQLLAVAEAARESQARHGGEALVALDAALAALDAAQEQT